MARPINYAKEKYPYDRWFSGRKRKLLRGQDYECKTASMRMNLINAASARGLEITFYEVDDESITFKGGSR